MTNNLKSTEYIWFGDIPNDWSINRIASIYVERIEVVSDKEYPALSITKTKNGVVPQVKEAVKNNNGDARRLVKKYDFVINTNTDNKGYCGVSQYIGSCSPINLVLKPIGNIDYFYYHYLFRTVSFINEFTRHAEGVVPCTRWPQIKNILIPIPPLVEQNKIVSYLNNKLSLIDQVINQETIALEKLSSYKSSLITEKVIAGCIQHNSFQQLDNTTFVIPKTWKQKSLKFLCNIKRGNSVNESDYVSVGSPMLLASNIQNNKIDWNNLVYVSNKLSKNFNRLNIGDIILLMMGNSIGKCAIIENLPYKIATVNGAHTIITPKTNELVNHYLFYFFISTVFIDHHKKNTSGTTSKTITLDILNSIGIPVPPIDEQIQIVNYLNERCNLIDKIIEQKQELIEKLKSYRESLVYEIVTGKKRI